MSNNKHRSEASSVDNELRITKVDLPQKGNVDSTKLKVRLNLVLRGDVARILTELRSRGIIRSYADCINSSIQLFYAAIIKQDLLSARLKALEKGCNNDNFGGEE